MAATEDATLDDIIQWYPIDLLRSAPHLPRVADEEPGCEDASRSGFALIVLNQPITHYLDTIKRLWRNGGFRIF